MNWLRRLFAAEGGSILVMAAFALTAVMGMAGLAVEIGTGYAAKARNQRVADMAALGAALAYQSNSDATQATQTAKDIVSASGLSASAAAVTVGTSSVQVDVTTAVPVRLASMISNAASYNVKNTAIASLNGPTTPACVLSLSKTAGTGVGISGNSNLTATGCAVTSNSPISVQGSSALAGSTITAPSISTTGNSSVTGSKQTGSNATDPLANNSALAAAFAQLGVTTTPTAVTMPTAPTIPVSTTDWTFPANATAFAALAAGDPVKTNCTLSGQAYSCSQNTYNINNFTLPSGMSVTFAGASVVNVYGTFSANGATLGGTGTAYNLRNPFTTNWGSSPIFGNIASLYVGGAVTYQGAGNVIGTGNVTFAGALNLGGSAALRIGAGTHAFSGISVSGSGSLVVGAGNLIVNGSIEVGGSATATFAGGPYTVGKNGSGQSLYVGGTVTMGNGDFSGTGGIAVNGGSTLTMGSGNITLGTATSGNAIDVGGSATMIMGAGDLSADGAVSTQGASSITFGAGKHSIDGDVSLKGGGTMGAGRYTINGNFDKGASTDVTATNVTIIAAGSFSTSGSSSMTLIAPAADNSSNGGIGGIAFASKTTSDSSIGGSSSNTLGGIFYVPNSDVSISGAGSVAGSTCFALVVKTLSVTGSGGAKDTNCTPATLTTTASVALIQ